MTTVIHPSFMRYPRAHKQATRRRILDAASQAFRERGVAETGVDEVMRRAGLTHGGFYSHFKDKTELIAEACAAAFDAAVPNLDRIAAAVTPAGRARLLIDSYLGLRHRDNRGSGCLVVAVGADMARLRGAARTGYAQGFARHLDRLAAALRLASDPHRNRERVTLLMSSLVGALLFARAVDDPVQSDAILHSIRRQLREQFCRDDAARFVRNPANDATVPAPCAPRDGVRALS
jgi:TetR/AcrR family transcriptional repressor of nem operon